MTVSEPVLYRSKPTTRVSGFRDLYIGIKDPWTKRCQLMAGVFNRPFGHEIGYSTSGLESPERATIIQYFFPDERDLGAMLTLRAKETSPIGFLRLDAGLFAGNSINRETDSRKDFIGRLGAERKSATGENGEQASPTTTAEFTTRRQPPTNSRIKNSSQSTKEKPVHT